MNRRSFLKAALAAGLSPRLALGAQRRDAMFVSLNSSLTRRMEWLDSPGSPQQPDMAEWTSTLAAPRHKAHPPRECS